MTAFYVPRRRKKAKMGTRTSERVRCEAHLQWVRGHFCVVGPGNCAGKIQAAHIRLKADGGLGLKPGDNFAVPLCDFHHRCQHGEGEITFWNYRNSQGIAGALKIAAELWDRSPAGKKYRAKQVNA